jgi:hypothetical protein
MARNEARSGSTSAKTPTKFRRLTRDEAASRGVSYTAKRQVARSIKRVTASTPLYSNRQAATAAIRRKTGVSTATRETYARERKTDAQKKKLIIVQPGGAYRDVMAQGSDITKILARNTAMAAARGTEERPADFGPLNAFKRRYKRHYVVDVDTGERVDLIMSREDLDRSKAQMNTAVRDEIDKRYAEDMAEA